MARVGFVTIRIACRRRLNEDRPAACKIFGLALGLKAEEALPVWESKV